MSIARDTWGKVRSLDTPVDYRLGPNMADRFFHDPKRIAFLFSRYKVASKILFDSRSILDAGCGDGMASALFLGTKARRIKGIDFDQSLIDHANNVLMPALEKTRPQDARRISFSHADLLDIAISGFQGVCSMDVIEHVQPERADDFVAVLYDALGPGGICVVGTPNKHAEGLASLHSKEGHINLYTPETLKEQMRKFFPTVIMGGLNDEVFHFGHTQLWHYILAIAIKS